MPRSQSENSTQKDPPVATTSPHPLPAFFDRPQKKNLPPNGNHLDDGGDQGSHVGGRWFRHKHAHPGELDVDVFARGQKVEACFPALPRAFFLAFAHVPGRCRGAGGRKGARHQSRTYITSNIANDID